MWLDICTFMQFAWRPEGGVRSPGAEVTTGSCEPRGCWDLNSGSLQEYSGVTTESSLQLLCGSFRNNNSIKCHTEGSLVN